MAAVELGDARIAYDEAGSGPVVIMVHAGIADRRMWDHQFARLSTRCRVVRYDCRGCGESSDAVGEFAHQADLLALMDVLDVRQATLVGSSAGGAYAMDLALAAPERVSGLVLICAGLSGYQWPAEMMNRLRARVHAVIPAQRLQCYRDGTATLDPADLDAMAEAHVRFMVVGPDRAVSDLAPGVWQQSLEMCRGVFEREWAVGASAPYEWLDPPAVGRLAEVSKPTLVVNGLADVPEIQHVSGLLAAGINGAEVVDLPRTGHLPPLERPATVTRLLERFLAGVGA